MKIKELVTCKVTLPKTKKLRDAGIWNLETNTTLRDAINKCLETGLEVVTVLAGGPLYHVRPEYPLIESAMQLPENQGVLKVQVVVYLSSEHVLVEKD